MDVLPSQYIHIGDACRTDGYEANPATIARPAHGGLTGPRALHGWFMGRIADHVVREGRRPVAWAEDGATLPPECAVISWRTPGTPAEPGLAGRVMETAEPTVVWVRRDAGAHRIPHLSPPVRTGRAGVGRHRQLAGFPEAAGRQPYTPGRPRSAT
ncbi:family 20 glycosylhydrolase [Streptomyces sp. NPDC002922]|uniref:family 20 glycosylhydrolase n=1 Tax=Streptomyces sp. NPDC002922 TaxID=3154439 RepID=UPI0033AA1C08